MTIPTTKPCKICHKIKSIENEFYTYGKKRPNERMARCKECFKAYVAGQRKMAGDYVAGYATAYSRFNRLLERLETASQKVLHCPSCKGSLNQFCYCRKALEEALSNVKAARNSLPEVRRTKAAEAKVSRLLQK
jgi:hypothetical protein